MAVDALVMVAHERPHGIGEAADAREQLVPGVGVLLDERVLLVARTGGLLEDRVGDRQLSDVVHEPADRKRAQAATREPEPFTDLDREQRDSPGVLLGVGVLLRETPGEPAYMRAEEELLAGDELDSVEVSGERPRRVRAGKIDRDRNTDDEDPVELELVAHPPAEVVPAHRQRGDDRRTEPHESDDDRQVEPASRQQERAQRPKRHDGVADEPEHEQDDRTAAALRWNRGNERRKDDRGGAEHRHEPENRHECPHEHADLAESNGKREHRERQDRAADGERRARVTETTPFCPTRIPGVAGPWSASSAAITAKALPTRTVRTSERLAPATVSAIAAPAVTLAVKPTPRK